MHNRFALLIEGGDVRASRSARDSDTDIQGKSEVELAIATPREEIGEPPVDLRRRRWSWLVVLQIEDVKVVNELRREG